MSDFDRNVAARGFGATRATDDRCRPARLHDPHLQLHGCRRRPDRLRLVADFNAAVVTDAAGHVTSLTPFGHAIFGGPLTIVLFLGTLGIVFFLSFRINKLQASTALVLFMLYAGLLGLMLSTVFLQYTGASITRTFFISAASFGALSLYGYTTQRDLSPIGSFLIMGLFGLILAMLVNIFLKSTRARLRHLGDRRADLCRPDRLGHAEDQGDVQRQ